jgi:MFS family permease
MHNTSEEPGYPRPAYAWYVVVILFLAFTVSYIDRQIISLLVDPIKADLGISDTQIGLLQGFAFTVFYTFAGIPLGRLADRKNRKIIITVGMFLWSLMTAACGLAKTFTHLFIARVGVGIGEASLSPAANSMITDYFPKDKRGKPVALYFMGVYVGVGLSFILGGMVISWVASTGEVVLPLVGELSAWQLTFMIVSIPGLLLVCLMPPHRKIGRRKQELSCPLHGERRRSRIHKLRNFVENKVGVALPHPQMLRSLCGNHLNGWYHTKALRGLGWRQEIIKLWN